MEDEYMEQPEMGDMSRNADVNEVNGDIQKDFGDTGYDENFDDDVGDNNFRNMRGRGGFNMGNRGRGRGPPPGWGGPPPRFRGRGYGPSGPPMRGRGFFRGRGGPRFGNGGPNFDNNWGPMGPPPGMMGGPPPFGPPPGMMPPQGPMGPPPNMMGHPPFGGPPGMPPPNMPGPELWVETKSDDGKSYYYHARTRETTWTRPQEGPTCKIITQADMEAMAVGNQMPAMGGPQMGMNGPMGPGGPGMGMMGGMPMGAAMPPASAATGLPPFMTHPPPWVKDGNAKDKGSEGNSPTDNDDLPPGESAPPQQQQQPNGPAPGMMPPFGGQPGQGPPGGFPGQPGGQFGGPMPGGPGGPMPGGPGGPMPGGPGGPMSGGPMSGPGGPMSGPGGPMSGPGGPMSGPGGPMSGPGGPMSGPGGPMPGPGGPMPGPGGPMPGPGGPMPGGQMTGPGGPMSGGMSGPGGQMPGGPMTGPGGPMPGGMSGPGGPMPGGPMTGPGGPMPGGLLGPGPGIPMPGGPMGGPGGPMGGPGGPGGGVPGAGFPGPGGWGGWGGWPPPLVAQPPPNMQAAAVPNAGAATQLGKPPNQSQTVVVPGQELSPVPSETASQPPATKEETVIPPELQAAADEWTVHRAPDGRPYYYHAARQNSVWEKPQPLRDLEELKAKIAAEKNEILKASKEIDEKAEVIDVDAHDEAQAQAEAERKAEIERQAAAERERQERERQEKERIEKEKAEKERLEKEKAEKEKAKLDKSRPISSTPISGTPWCVVWTGDGRVFFYNPTAHSSVWERPPQLAGRQDVDQAVSQPPDALLQLQRKEAAANAKAPNGELKRGADSSSDDDEAEPAKRQKHEEASKKTLPSTKIDLGQEAAIEAEVRAARERAVVPLEQRMRSFRAMLEHNDVSAFSTWEKELHKIVFDPRYLLLTSKERKQVFDKYVRERAEEERKEKKNRLQQKKLAFRTLMEEAKLHSKSSYTEFSSKHGRDDRFKAIEKPRDRETYFNEYLAEVRKREKEEKDRKREQAKTDFLALLKEKNVDRHLRWNDAKKKVENEPRYKAVESSVMREDYFREYCRMAKEERKRGKEEKDKERDRSAKKEKKDKDREKDKDKDKEKEGKDKDGKKDKKKDKTEDSIADVEQADGEADGEGATETEEGGDEEARARERDARAQASIKEREREVQRALATSLRDRDKERQYHKRDEAVQHFNALLADLVRNPDLAWRDAKKQLKKDHRYSLADNLSKDDKERLFSQHIAMVSGKRRDKLRALLTEWGISTTAHWRDVKHKLKAEPTAPQYASASQMEREFREYQRDKQSAAKTALRQLLLETRFITHKSHAQAKESPAAMQAIHDSLKHDARYLALEHMPEEREQMIKSYLEELERKGPPPPPTATEPPRRAKQ